jgi:hypothetical protein
MPTRTTTVELCDLCYAGDRPKEVEAADHLTFSWSGHQFALLACQRHAEEVRDQLDAYADVATQIGVERAARRSPRAGRGPNTLYSQLSDEDKGRFRKWANMPNARRISDDRVQQWEQAGRP